jgi:hypothetical protein
LHGQDPRQDDAQNVLVVAGDGADRSVPLGSVGRTSFSVRSRDWDIAGIIDLSAILLSLSALTGMATLVSLRARRRSGFIVAVLGVVSIVTVYVIWVPH